MPLVSFCCLVHHQYFIITHDNLFSLVFSFTEAYRISSPKFCTNPSALSCLVIWLINISSSVSLLSQVVTCSDHLSMTRGLFLKWPLCSDTEKCLPFPLSCAKTNYFIFHPLKKKKLLPTKTKLSEISLLSNRLAYLFIYVFIYGRHNWMIKGENDRSF